MRYPHPYALPTPIRATTPVRSTTPLPTDTDVSNSSMHYASFDTQTRKTYRSPSLFSIVVRPIASKEDVEVVKGMHTGLESMEHRSKFHLTWMKTSKITTERCEKKNSPNGRRRHPRVGDHLSCHHGRRGMGLFRGRVLTTSCTKSPNMTPSSAHTALHAGGSSSSQSSPSWSTPSSSPSPKRPR